MAKKKKPLRPLSETQLEIMNLAWDRGEVTVGEVWNEVSQHRTVSRNTIQTTMMRLEDKGWLKHRVEGQTFYYSACQRRESTQQRLVCRLIDTAFGGSVEGIMMALLQGRGVSAEEAERIRQLIEEAKREQK